jgi:glycine cleavage system H lipoate-binding protein
MVLILLALTILGCIAVEVYFRRKEKRGLAESLRLGEEPGVLPFWASHELPDGLFVHSGHTWAKVGSSGDVQVGLDGFAQGILGKVDRFDLPAKGTEIRQGEPVFAAVQSGKRIEFVSPVDGMIREVNERINADLQGAKREPYKKGWAFEIRPYDLAGNLKKLRIGREASGWLEKEVRNFAEFLNLHRAVPQGIGVTMPDGGVHTEGILETMNGEVLQLVIRKFLR